MLQVSFYSYKGGAGRSTTSWNTIQRLVGLMNPTEKEPFVIVDTDTESAGSTFLYRAKGHFEKSKLCMSIQKRIKDGQAKNYVDPSSDEDKSKFFNGMHPIGTSFFGLPKDRDKAVLFIGADLDKNSREDMRNLEKNENGTQMIKNFKNIAKACKRCGAKALFFDTPSGTQDLARQSIQYSDIIVCCMRPTNQFREGTIGQLTEFIINDRNESSSRKYILTPTAICVDPGQKFTLGGQKEDYPQKSKEDIKMAFSKNEMQNNVFLDMLDPTPNDSKIYSKSEDNDTVFGIPEVKRFKWFENCLGILEEDELSENDKMAINRYEYLARTILKYSKE